MKRMKRMKCMKYSISSSSAAGLCSTSPSRSFNLSFSIHSFAACLPACLHLMFFEEFVVVTIRVRKDILRTPWPLRNNRQHHRCCRFTTARREHHGGFYEKKSVLKR